MAIFRPFFTEKTTFKNDHFWKTHKKVVPTKINISKMAIFAKMTILKTEKPEGSESPLF